VLKGEMHAIVDTGETLLRAGDVFIQRGAMHSWSVRGTDPCIIAAVLVSADPIGKRAATRKKKRAVKRPAKKAARKAAKPGKRTVRRPRKTTRHR